jgi:UDP-N-acetylmuramate dehydrogenase
MTIITETQWDKLVTAFGDGLKRGISLAPYTSARVGGPADGLITVGSKLQLEKTVLKLWELDVPFLLIGGGSNILVSDSGVRSIVIINRAKQIDFFEDKLTVWAESGASFGGLARKVSKRGYSGLEWAAGIPGTVGGAVFGNSGAHGSNVAHNLLVAEILHPSNGKQEWTSSQLGYEYRSSILKREKGRSIILSASFKYDLSTIASTKKRIEVYSRQRKGSQPPGASIGSVFKNPTGEYAGRLIERVGLKGKQIGAAIISPIHANFIVNQGGCQADDILSLLRLAQEKVSERFGVVLEPEIELIGDWETSDA